MKKKNNEKLMRALKKQKAINAFKDDELNQKDPEGNNPDPNQESSSE